MERGQEDEDSSVDIVVTNDSCREEGKSCCLKSKGKEQWKREGQQNGTNYGVLKKTRNKTLPSCQCENPHPT